MNEPDDARTPPDPQQHPAAGPLDPYGRPVQPPGPPPAQPTYEQVHGYAPPPPPRHDSAVTAMVVGIVAIAGAMLCLVPLVIAPVAWVLGARAVTAIDASGGRLSGRAEATAGKVLGIVGTVLLVPVLLLVAGLVALTLADPGFWLEP